jgi:hypothetical protein
MAKTDDDTQIRIALLDYYSSQEQTHGTYILGVALLMFTLLEVNIQAPWYVRGGLMAVTTFGLLYFGIRALHWAYLSQTIVAIGDKINEIEEFLIKDKKLAKDDPILKDPIRKWHSLAAYYTYFPTGAYSEKPKRPMVARIVYFHTKHKKVWFGWLLGFLLIFLHAYAFA